MSFHNYSYESEDNCFKSRVGCYINLSIDYTRRRDLEEKGLHLIILDVKSHKNVRLINVYRPFNPRNGMNPREFFNRQLNIIRRSYTKNTIILGDFNLDWNMNGVHNYAFRNYFTDMDGALSGTNRIQLVEFPTWSITVNNVVKYSTLDHVYSNNSTDVSCLEQIDPLCGDHCVVNFWLNSMKHSATFSNRHN
jgi:endonuclease/exonuclease/phosphatase family metal-dependent hydrolase